MQKYFTLILTSLFFSSSLIFANPVNSMDSDQDSDIDEKCVRFFNTKDVTPCECLDIDDLKKRLDCVKKQHANLYDFMRNSTYYTVNTNGVISDLGFSEWADLEFEYINLLDYQNSRSTQVRQVIYTQNVLQKGMSLFRSRGIMFGGGYSQYVTLIEKYKSMLPKSHQFPDDEDNFSKEDILSIEESLLTILNELRSDINNNVFDQAQQKWMSMYHRNIEQFSSESHFSPTDFEYEQSVLEPLLQRINNLEEYLNPDSELTRKRLFRFPISPLELYELLTDDKLQYFD